MFGAHFNTLQKALTINPDYLRALNNLAYLLATCQKAHLRDGVKAEELAQRANQITGRGNATFLGTLAAAYAEQGRFSEAIHSVQQAIQLADAKGNSDLSALLQEHLKLYQQGQPLGKNR